MLNHAGNIEGSTENGEIECDMYGFPSEGELTMSSTNGKITLRMPSQISTDFTVSCVNGSVTVAGFPIIDYTRNDPKRKEGTIGDGGASVTISTVNGNIIFSGKE